MKSKILERGFAECVREDRGEFDLGAFELGETYQYELVDKDGNIYYRLHSPYAEYPNTCDANIFNNYFRKINTI